MSDKEASDDIESKKRQREETTPDKDKGPTAKNGSRFRLRRRCNIDFIEDRSRRNVTFSKRKSGIMKKAYELSTLTGAQVLLLIGADSGQVFTFATPKLRPIVEEEQSKAMIVRCLSKTIPQEKQTSGKIWPLHGTQQFRFVASDLMGPTRRESSSFPVDRNVSQGQQMMQVPRYLPVYGGAGVAPQYQGDPQDLVNFMLGAQQRFPAPSGTHEQQQAQVQALAQQRAFEAQQQQLSAQMRNPYMFQQPRPQVFDRNSLQQAAFPQGQASLSSEIPSEKKQQKPNSSFRGSVNS